MRGAILLVEDDPKTSSVVRLYLERAGYQVTTVADGRSALASARKSPPELVLLDLMLPGLDGLAVCRALKSESDVPVIMVTARTTEEDRLAGLDLGADDYVSKPFSPRELVARVKAVLRRSSPERERTRTLVLGRVRIDVSAHQVDVDGQVARPLTPTEWKLLLAFARAPGRAFTRAELVERAFGADHDALDRTVDAHVVKLRRKLPELDLETVYGIGYRLRDPERPEASR